MVVSHDSSAAMAIVESMTAVEFDPERDLFFASYDSDSDPASLSVVAVVAAANECNPLDLPPLHGTIETDALDAVFAESATGGTEHGSPSFAYDRFEVTVFGDGLIEADPLDSA